MDVSQMPMSETTQIIIATISGVVSLIGTCFTAWITLQMARLKRDNHEVKDKLDVNTNFTRQVKHEVANAAQTAVMVKASLDHRQKTLDEKVDKIVEIGLTTKRLVNGNRTKELRTIATQAQEIAALTNDDAKKAIADEAIRVLADHEHHLAQAEIEANSAISAEKKISK